MKNLFENYKHGLAGPDQRTLVALELCLPFPAREKDIRGIKNKKEDRLVCVFANIWNVRYLGRLRSKHFFVSFSCINDIRMFIWVL